MDGWRNDSTYYRRRSLDETQEYYLRHSNDIHKKVFSNSYDCYSRTSPAKSNYKSRRSDNNSRSKKKRNSKKYKLNNRNENITHNMTVLQQSYVNGNVKDLNNTVQTVNVLEENNKKLCDRFKEVEFTSTSSSEKSWISNKRKISVDENGTQNKTMKYNKYKKINADISNSSNILTSTNDVDSHSAICDTTKNKDNIGKGSVSNSEATYQETNDDNEIKFSDPKADKFTRYHFEVYLLSQKIANQQRCVENAKKEYDEKLKKLNEIKEEYEKLQLKIDKNYKGIINGDNSDSSDIEVTKVVYNLGSSSEETSEEDEEDEVQSVKSKIDPDTTAKDDTSNSESSDENDTKSVKSKISTQQNKKRSQQQQVKLNISTAVFTNKQSTSSNNKKQQNTNIDKNSSNLKRESREKRPKPQPQQQNTSVTSEVSTEQQNISTGASKLSLKKQRKLEKKLKKQQRVTSVISEDKTANDSEKSKKKQKKIEGKLKKQQQYNTCTVSSTNAVDEENISVYGDKNSEHKSSDISVIEQSTSKSVCSLIPAKVNTDSIWLCKDGKLIILDMKIHQNKLFVAASRGILRVYNIDTHEVILDYIGHIDHVHCLLITAYYPKINYVIFSGGFSKTLILHDVKDENPIARIKESHPIMCVCDNSRFCYYGTSAGEIGIYSFEECKKLMTFRASKVGITSLATTYTSFKFLLFVGTNDSRVQVYNGISLSLLRDITPDSMKSPSIGFILLSQRLLVYEKNNVHFIYYEEDKVPVTYNHLQHTNSLCLIKKHIIIGQNDGRVAVYKIKLSAGTSTNVWT